ncbi:MAG: hypothetical protein H0V56_13825, partial [Chthoniobacterales bacterium]|nr:hypothetical protein [Chthoniobacterales bacterium]
TQLARAHLAAYWFHHDHTPTRLALAQDAIDAAARLRPNDGDVHLARARLHYWGSRDYAAALAELELARRALPNEPEIVYFTSLVERRRGDWEKSLRHNEEAAKLDPRNVNILDNLVTTRIALRQYAEAAQLLDEIIVWRPNDFNAQLTRAWVDVFFDADVRRLQSAVSSDFGEGADSNRLATARLHLALLRRDYAGAKVALSACRDQELQPELSDLAYVTPRQWYEGVIARATGDDDAAQVAFQAAREWASVTSTRRPHDGRAMMVLAEIEARLGRTADAIRAGERAAELLPVAKDALDGPIILRRLAGVYAQVGDKRRALETLEQAARTPNGVHHGSLKLDEVWDPLRGDARFDTIVASLAPKRRAP